MSKKELARQAILLRVDRGELTMSDGASELGISVRQLRRSRRRHGVEGLAGLAHKGRGKASGRALPPQMANTIKKLLRERYPDFGATFAAEKLTIDLGRRISNEKVRQIQIEQGLHRPKKRRQGRYHPRRTRRSCEGELVQSDGSIHDWLEGRDAPMTLITFIDDATSKIKYAGFVESESTAAYMSLSKAYIESFGCPQALYVDKHSIFRKTHQETRERGSLTNFGQALKELNIELICANSPQAKGRVERGFGTLQDRLIKEMRLAGITSMEAANKFLPDFIVEYNNRFSVPAASPVNAHRKLSPDTDLKWIFTNRVERTLSKNLTFHYEGILYQVKAPALVNRLRNQKVAIRTSPELEMRVMSSWGKHLDFEAYQEPDSPAQMTIEGKDLNRLWADKRRKPSKHHPWK